MESNKLFFVAHVFSDRTFFFKSTLIYRTGRLTMTVGVARFFVLKVSVGGWNYAESLYNLGLQKSTMVESTRYDIWM